MPNDRSNSLSETGYCRCFNVCFSETSPLNPNTDFENVCFSEASPFNMRTDFEVAHIPPTNYNKLLNKPIINGVTLEGSLILSQLGLRAIYYDTTANWDAQASLVSEEGALYIYSDHQVITDGAGNVAYIPGIRIGDGSSYLRDLAFLSGDITAAFYEHINNMSVHVTPLEKEFWNHKVSSYLEVGDTENLVLSKTNYTTQGDIYYG